MKKRQIKQDELFNILVINGFTFLSKAIDEIEEFPKFSVINFYTAVELLLKARLMKEHWSLVVARKQFPDWDKFINGNFQSVNLSQCNDLLKSVIKSGLSREEYNAFDKLRQHRNKVVHFFHEDFERQENKKINYIIKEQYVGWYFLKQLIEISWKNEFSTFHSKVTEIDSKFRVYKGFLQVIYDQVKEEISIAQNSGSFVVKCPVCHFDSICYKSDEEIITAKCLVCDYQATIVALKCCDCDNTIRFVDEGYSTCTKCKRKHTPKDLVEHFYTNEDFEKIMIGEDSTISSCNNCSDGYHNLVGMNGKYFCVNCFSWHDDVGWCEWCNEPQTGNLEDSYYNGCAFCDGKI